MKRFFGFALIVASLAIPAFAAKNSQSITLTDAVKVGSTQLPAGAYKLTWTGTGSSVQLTIADKGKNTVTVPAKIVDSKNGHVAVLTNTVGGASVLESIQLDNLSLVLTGATASGE
ncbi:MAG TPA: hypothetical protein VHW46_06020 [Terracidiphilus sp.]|jgi:hypothetical protein|nr:hypothetical protein [Terracidiphilus sp.]